MRAQFEGCFATSLRDQCSITEKEESDPKIMNKQLVAVLEPDGNRAICRHMMSSLRVVMLAWMMSIELV